MKPDWRWHLIQLRFQEHKIVKAFELFRRHNIEPVLIKGWAAAANYPLRQQRISVDIDLCVAPRDYKQAQKILKDEAENRLSVDLHCGLRHLDTVEWDDLFAGTRLFKLQETSVRVLRPEDHLRILCVHWLNDGGANKERLSDIFYAVENRPPDFDWKRCLETVDRKRRKWIVCALGLAHRYLGLDLESSPCAAEAKVIPRWVIETIEKEWAEENPLKSLRSCLSDRREFFRQLRKRFPPNPIQATVEVNGDFDDKPRIFYQLADVVIRIKPSLEGFFRSRL